MQLSFIHNGNVIEFEVIFRKRQSLGIMVEAGGKVTVIAPPGTSKEVILQKAEQKANWIIKQLEHFAPQKTQARELLEGELFLYRGQLYPLHLEIEPTVSKPDIGIKQGKLWIRISSEDNDLLKDALENWYRYQARDRIIERIVYYQDRIGRVPGRVCIKDQKRRWGSCSARGNLNFNWRLVMAPDKVLDYVVVHELCHLLELNHSKEFWSLLASILPDYKERKDWLKNNGYRMRLYEKPVKN